MQIHVNGDLKVMAERQLTKYLKKERGKERDGERQEITRKSGEHRGPWHGVNCLATEDNVKLSVCNCPVLWITDWSVF